MQSLTGLDLGPSDLGTRVVAKLTRRLLPFLFLLYIVAYLDRINVGFAALQMKGSWDSAMKFMVWGRGFFLPDISFSRCRAISRCPALARAGG
jgi:hypothetical protein